VTRVSIGISPCPNDTFAFHGLLERKVEVPGLELEIVLDDVESLNRRFAAGELDAAKCSIAAALRLADRAVVLRAGSALGSGLGPVVLARSGTRNPGPDARVLCPGEGTTAFLLYRLFHPREGRIEHARFSEILPRVAAGEADLGVCIHEARFTYTRHGLVLVEDLGTTWERATGAPLPLGGILARKSLGQDVLDRLARAVRASLDRAFERRAETLPTMRRHAQEMDDDVIWKHVELYVTERTLDLGPEGRDALAKLRAAAIDAGFLAADAALLEVV